MHTVFVTKPGSQSPIKPEGVVIIDPSTGEPQLLGGRDRELVVSTYHCKTAFAGASVGDTITATQVLDVSAAPTTVSTVWRNQTTATDLSGAPLAANLEIVGAQALTDAQLRAAPLQVRFASFDSTGQAFNPDSCTHTYAYTNGLLTTDTATDGTTTWVKTYSYTAGVLTGETKWVRQ